MTITAGLLIAIATAEAKGVDWYRYAPTSMVLSDLMSHDDGKALFAWSEINRRLTAGQLSDDCVTGFIERLLSEQSAPAARALSHEMVNMLGEASIQRAMTESQLQRFFTNLVTDLTLSVGSPGAAGEGYSIGFHFSQCAPTMNCQVILRLASLRCEHEELLWNQVITQVSGCGSCIVRMQQKLPGSGTRFVEAVVCIEVYEDVRTATNESKPQWVSPPQTLTASIED